MNDRSPPPPGATPPSPPPPPPPLAAAEPDRGIVARLLDPGGSQPVWAEWGASGAVLGVVGAVIAVIAGGILLVPFVGTKGLDAKLANQLILSLAFIGVALAIAAQGQTRMPMRELGLLRPRYGHWVALTAQAFVVVVAFAVVFSRIAQPEQSDAAEQLGFNASVVGAIVAGFAIVVAAPVCEEIFFRGLLFGGLRKTLPFVGAALVSGVFFGAIHLATGNVAAAVQLSFLGVVLAWLYERSGSLWAPMALHGVNNAIAFTLLVAT